MEQITLFLNQILRHSFLSKREKAEWMEEMSAHLHTSIEHFKTQGFSDDQAVEKSIEKFGSPSELKDKLTKETYGFKSKTILLIASLSLILFVGSLIGGLGLNWFGIHNRYIEILPVLFITCSILGISLFLTRKRMDRICLIFMPVLFAVGYLQAYFHFLSNSFGNKLDFAMFENLFFSGAYDYSNRFNFMLIGCLFLIGQSTIIYLISKNRYLSVLPAALSIVYTVTHMIIFKLYYALFLSVDFMSAVTLGYDRFTQGNTHRIIDIVLKLVVLVLLFVIFNVIEKSILKLKRKAII
ncbi:hypothetical protein J2T13_002444 [Paenibacillus sp. DS2015]|uniref:permease prefix domain 1-containing protein n=1 Tax=Paenibacillus sp. DS2015 TaxID=3373917 RepID=UPI003D2409F9